MRPWFVSAFYTLELDLLINRPCSIFGIQNAVPKLPPRLISDLFQLFPFLTAFPITFPVVLSRVSPSTLVTSSLCHWPSNSTTSIIILAFENVMQGRVSSPLVEVDNLVFTFSHCSPDIQNWVNKHKVQQNPEKTVASFTGTRQRLTLLHQVYSVITLAVVLNSPFPCSPTSPSLEKNIGFCHHLRLSTIRHCLSIHVTAVLVVTPLPFFFFVHACIIATSSLLACLLWHSTPFNAFRMLWLVWCTRDIRLIRSLSSISFTGLLVTDCITYKLDSLSPTVSLAN